MTRTLAIAAILAALLFAQFIGTAYQPSVVRSADNAAVVPAPATATSDIDQRALEELAAWPAAR